VHFPYSTSEHRYAKESVYSELYSSRKAQSKRERFQVIDNFHRIHDIFEIIRKLCAKNCLMIMQCNEMILEFVLKVLQKICFPNQMVLVHHR